MDEMPNNMDAKTQWYDFLWSRTRAIRKEITQQALVDKTAVRLVEKFDFISSLYSSNL